MLVLSPIFIEIFSEQKKKAQWPLGKCALFLCSSASRGYCVVFLDKTL